VLVNGLLVESFPEIVSSDFTAKMESDLDHVEDGQRDWRKLLGEFYRPFELELQKAESSAFGGIRELCAVAQTTEERGDFAAEQSLHEHIRQRPLQAARLRARLLSHVVSKILR